jgi:hypothetical protein
MSDPLKWVLVKEGEELADGPDFFCPSCELVNVHCDCEGDDEEE